MTLMCHLALLINTSVVGNHLPSFHRCHTDDAYCMRLFIYS